MSQSAPKSPSHKAASPTPSTSPNKRNTSPFEGRRNSNNFQHTNFSKNFNNQQRGNNRHRSNPNYNRSNSNSNSNSNYHKHHTYSRTHTYNNNSNKNKHPNNRNNNPNNSSKLQTSPALSSTPINHPPHGELVNTFLKNETSTFAFNFHLSSPTNIQDGAPSSPTRSPTSNTSQGANAFPPTSSPPTTDGPFAPCTTSTSPNSKPRTTDDNTKSDAPNLGSQFNPIPVDPNEDHAMKDATKSNKIKKARRGYKKGKKLAKKSANQPENEPQLDTPPLKRQRTSSSPSTHPVQSSPIRPNSPPVPSPLLQRPNSPPVPYQNSHSLLQLPHSPPMQPQSPPIPFLHNLSAHSHLPTNPETFFMKPEPQLSMHPTGNLPPNPYHQNKFYHPNSHPPNYQPPSNIHNYPPSPSFLSTQFSPKFQFSPAHSPLPSPSYPTHYPSPAYSYHNDNFDSNMHPSQYNNYHTHNDTSAQHSHPNNPMRHNNKKPFDFPHNRNKQSTHTTSTTSTSTHDAQVNDTSSNSSNDHDTFSMPRQPFKPTPKKRKPSSLSTSSYEATATKNLRSKYGPNTIYICNLPQIDTTELETQLRNFFSRFGTINFLRAIPQDNIAKGTAYVTFDSHLGVENAMKETLVINDHYSSMKDLDTGQVSAHINAFNRNAIRVITRELFVKLNHKENQHKQFRLDNVCYGVTYKGDGEVERKASAVIKEAYPP